VRPAPALAEWAEWEALAGTDPAAEVVLVSEGAVAAAGLVLAAVLCLALWLFRHRPARRRLAFLLLWLAAAGVAVAWLPAALRDLALLPLLPACAVAVGWYVVALRRPAARKAPATVIAPAAATAGLLVALFHLPDAGRALPPAADAQKVYVLPGPPEQPDAGPVLLAPKLRDDLRALARPPALVSSGAVLLSASYEGRMVDGAAEFDATYQAYCLGKEPATLALPLDGVSHVGDVWLDGARAFPAAATPPQPGFTLALSGRGLHKIELRFRAGVTRAGGDRDVQFTAPRLLQNHLRLELPPSAGYAQAVSRCGAEQVTAAGAGAALEADLGRLTGPVHLRWLEEALPPAPVRVQYREAYFWDLRPDAPSLSALVHFNVTQGHAQTLSVNLPPELDVRKVEPRRPGGGGEVRLREWRVQAGAGGARALRLRFQTPVSGELLVGLQLVPSAPLPPTTALPLPTPQGTPAPDAAYLGYRSQGLDVQRVAAQRLQAIKPEGFAPFWPDATRPDPAAFTYCASFRREGGAAPVLRVQLRPAAPAVQAVQELRLRVDGRVARLFATAELTSPHDDLSFVEWDLQSPQPLTVSAVSGDGATAVRNWSQSGNRLLVWLEKTGGSAKVRITGWLPLAQPKEGPRLDLPCLRPLGAAAPQTTVRVVPGVGLAVAPATLSNMLPLPGPQPGGPELAFASKQSSYRGALTVRPAAAAADVRVLTFVEVLEHKVTFRATVDYRVEGGALRALQVRLRDWDGEEVQVDAPRALPPGERRRAVDDRTWTLEFRPEDGVTGTYRLTLSGSVPLDEAVGGLPVPQVSVPDAAHVERWLAVAGPDLGAEAAFGLTEVKDYDKALAPWPGPRDRLRHVGGRVWKASADGTLRLVARDRGGEAAPIRVLLAERSAAVADNQRWLHEADYWLRHEAHTDLNWTLPAAARVVAVSLDGVDSPPLQPEPTRLWLPLPGVAGVRRVRLRWVYDPPEPLDRPNLEPPKLDGAEDGSCLWTVNVPPGYSADRPTSGLKPALARAAALDLRRADAQLQISRRLVEQAPGNLLPVAAPLRAAQRRFAELCRRGEGTLDAAGEAPGETGPGGLSLREWLQQLRTQNRDLAQRGGFDDVRADAERPAAPEESSGSLPRRGVPLYGVTEPDAPAPRLQLTAEAVRRERAAWLASAPWVGGVLLVWVLSFFPPLLAWGRRFVPEQFAAAGGVAWLLGGPAVVVLFLLLVAVLARVLGAGQWLAARLHRPAVRLASSSKPGSVPAAP
jgi:hypothetical protein